MTVQNGDENRYKPKLKFAITGTFTKQTGIIPIIV